MTQNDASKESGAFVSFTHTFVSGEQEVRQALRRLRDALARMKLSVENAETAELVVGEVLNNIVEHAYGSDRNGPIKVECNRARAALRFRITDGGRAYEGLQLPAGDPPIVELPREELPEGGFGWFLVHSLASGLRYARNDDANILKFSIDLNNLSLESAK